MTSKIHWGRLVAGAIAAEAIPVVLLIGIVAIVGPKESAEAEVFAASLGRWIGPWGGAIATFVLAVWAARPLNDKVMHGVLLGSLVASIDASLLIASGSSFEWLFVFSGAGRVVAGFLGGYFLSRKVEVPAVE